jgi:hypothetical protein
MIFLYPMADQFDTVHTRLTEYAPYFDGCIGATDGTHIPVTVDESLRLDYMNRNGETTMNVCVVVDLHGHFTFVGVGMVGSAHDSAVLDRCRENSLKFPHPPEGVYCVLPGCSTLPTYFITYIVDKRCLLMMHCRSVLPHRFWICARERLYDVVLQHKVHKP